MKQSCSKNVLCYWHPQTFPYKLNFWSYENVYFPQQYKTTSKMLVFRWGQSWRLLRYDFYLETFHQTSLISTLNFDEEIQAQKILRADEPEIKKGRERRAKSWCLLWRNRLHHNCVKCYICCITLPKPVSGQFPIS